MKNVFMNRPLKNPLFWTGTAYLLYLAFALLLFPYIAEKKAVEYVKTEFGRDLVVEKISLNPFTLKLSVKNLFFHEPDGGMFVKWEEFSVNPALFPLLKKTLVLQDISLTASEISIVKLKDGSFNFESLIKPGEEKKPETEEKSGWMIVIDNLRLHNVGILYSDNTYNPPFSLDLLNISVDTKNIVIGGPEESVTKLNFDFEGGGSFALEGDFVINPLNAEFGIHLKDLNLPAFNTILSSSTDLKLSKGLLYSGINVSLKDNFDKQRPDFLLKGDIELKNIAVNDLKTDSLLISFDKFNASISSLTTGPLAVDISEIGLKGLYADIRKNYSGTYNITDAIEKEQDQTVAEPDSSANAYTKEPSVNPDIKIRKIVLEDNRIFYEDLSNPVPFRENISSFNCSVENIKLFSSDSSSFKLDFILGNSEVNSLSGFFRHKPLSAGVHSILRKIDLKSANSFLPDKIKLKLSSARLSADLNSFYDPSAKTSQLQTSGDIFLTDFSFRDSTGNELLKWKEISLSDLKFENEPLKSRISLIKLKDLYSDIVISKNKELNLASAFGSSGTPADSVSKAEAVDSSQAPAEKLDIIVKKVSLENNSIKFADNSLPLPFATTIEKINSTISNIDMNSSDRTNINLKGIADKSGTASITGDLFIIDPLKNSQMDINFDKISLIQYSPYSAKYIGNYINTGSLSLFVKYNILNSKLTSENKILIDKVTFGKEFDSDERIHLPVKLAIALLKDKNGLIDFDIEVSGDLSDPKINTGSLIWQALKKVLVNIAASPIRFLAKSLGLQNSDDFDFVEFDFGETILKDTENKKLDDLSKALREKPDLKLSVTGIASRSYDKVTIQNRKLRKLIITEAGKPYDSLKTSERKDLLEKLVTKLDTTQNLDSLKVKHSRQEKKTLKLDTLKYNTKLFVIARSSQTTSDNEIIVLTSERADAIRSRLAVTDSIPEEQIIILPGEIIDEKSIKTIRTKLSIDIK